MFEKVLVANRGEIAVRVMQTCREMDIRTVAVYSTADRDSLHVQTADEAYCIGPPPAESSYLNIDSILNAAVRSGAQAVHPGYGFLSENPRFAEACATAGLTFIGPPPEVLRLLGDKAAAKKLAESLGVSGVPGYLGERQDDETLLREAGEIGFPVLIKAAGGGGGRGMRMVGDEADFGEAVAAARREAGSSFGDETLILERFLERPRHIEVQVIADKRGNILNLGERECSVQRRYQKVIEESPSPAVDDDLRRRMGDAAVKLTTAAGYENAGTVEFLWAGDAFFFLEVNPRLQVEHPVTEWTTGLDLVRLQLLVADGQILPMGQKDITMRGHSIEARIYSEDARRGYLPDAGRLSRFATPSGPGIRNDVGVYEGADVPIFYDSLLAKLTVYGHDRRQAAERLRWALERYVVLGVTTNLPMLRAIAADREFAEGNTDTQFVTRRIEPLLQQEDELPSEVLLSATAFKLADSGLLQGSREAKADRDTDPWRGAGPWRQGRVGMEFRYGYQGRTLRTAASQQPGTQRWKIDIGHEVFDVELSVTGDRRVEVRRDSESWAVEATLSDGGLSILWGGTVYLLEKPQPASIQEGGTGGPEPEAGASLQAPMPGIVVQVRVEEDQEVSARQVLLVLEAMKMEHLILAPYAGVVRRVLCKEGAQIDKGATLLELEPS